MSENAVPQEQGAKTLDFTGVTVIGLAAASGVTSINGDTTPAQVIGGSAGITVNDIGGGNHVLTVSQDLQSINGDTTQAQTIASPDHSITVTNPGGGTTDLVLKAFIQQHGTGITPVTIPDAVETTVLTDTVGAPGFYLFLFNVNAAGTLPGTIQVRARIYSGANVVCEQITIAGVDPTTNGYACSIASYIVQYAGGEVITCKLLADTGGGTFDIFATQTLLRVGA